MESENKADLPSDIVKLNENSVEFYIYQKDLGNIPSKSMQVFYNKTMELNRDVTSLAINTYANFYAEDEKVSVIESMSASGIGAIRIFKECLKIKKIVINDINPLAVNLINQNIKLNNLESKEEIIISQKDANLLFNEISQNNDRLERNEKSKIDVILIDPFGTPNKFLDSAFKAIKKKDGLLCVTATDTAVLFGTRPKSCQIKYLSKPLHTEYCKEIGARILVLHIIRLANMNNVGVYPLMTFYSNHFIRVIALTFKGKKLIKESLMNHGFIFHCFKCLYRSSVDSPIKVPVNCPNCGEDKRIDYGGPLWLGNIHDLSFLNHIITLNQNLNLKNKKKIDKILNLEAQEINAPFTYYNIHKWGKKLNLSRIPKLENIITAIKAKGFQVSRTSFDFLSIKSNIDIQNLETLLLELTS